MRMTDLHPDVVDIRVIDFDWALFARGLQMTRGRMALPRILAGRQKGTGMVGAVDSND